MGESVALVVMDTGSLRGLTQKAMKEVLWGDPRMTCRVVLLPTHLPNETLSLLR